MTDQKTPPTETILERLIVALGQRAKTGNELLTAQNEILQDIALSLKEFVRAANPAPAYQKPLAEFPNFDWASIGATVVKSDGDGVCAVEWQGKIFTRRAGSATYDDNVVYFSCSAGKDPTTGNNRYDRLITFKDAGKARELSRGTSRKLGEVETRRGNGRAA
jgi:hypothetical protein